MKNIGDQFCAARLPDTVASDLCATQPGPNRHGTNLLTVSEAEQVLQPIVRDLVEKAWRAGHAAAEETLGAHGSDHLLAAIERSWAEYAADQGLTA